jgi:hypothetical protein
MEMQQWVFSSEIVVIIARPRAIADNSAPELQKPMGRCDVATHLSHRFFRPAIM